MGIGGALHTASSLQQVSPFGVCGQFEVSLCAFEDSVREREGSKTIERFAQSLGPHD